MSSSPPSRNFHGQSVSEDVLRAAAAVRFLVLDVDGVCTDGKLYFQENGHPLKCFHAQDGIGIKTALLGGHRRRHHHRQKRSLRAGQDVAARREGLLRGL